MLTWFYTQDFGTFNTLDKQLCPPLELVDVTYNIHAAENNWI